MKELILVKYAPEIFLKGLNRGKFERKLRDNIAKKLDGIKAEFIHDSGRYFIKTDEIEEYLNEIMKDVYWQNKTNELQYNFSNRISNSLILLFIAGATSISSCYILSFRPPYLLRLYNFDMLVVLHGDIFHLIANTLDFLLLS